MLTRKGVYPYSYMDSWDKFEETTLPPREKFYSDLTKSHISDDEFKFIHELWDTFGLKNLGELHDLYMETDVALLADIFENFREFSLQNYRLDAAHFTTAPGLSWAASMCKPEESCRLQEVSCTLLEIPCFEAGVFLQHAGNFLWGQKWGGWKSPI